MDSLTQFRQYFAGKAASMGLDFQYGGSDRILSRQAGDLRYPLLWLEVPDVELLRSGGLKRRYNGGLVILQDAPADDWAAQDAALESTLSLAESLLKAMDADGENGLFEFDMGQVSLQPKTWWSGDGDCGWRIEFGLVTGQCDCDDCEDD